MEDLNQSVATVLLPTVEEAEEEEIDVEEEKEEVTEASEKTQDKTEE